jgi:hypothetical protein
VRLPSRTTDWTVHPRNSPAHSPLLCVPPFQPMGQLSVRQFERLLFWFNVFTRY